MILALNPAPESQELRLPLSPSMADLQIASNRLENRILLIEDNASNRQLLSEYLEHCGYEVLGLPDGSLLFQSLEQFQPVLVLLDLKLPGVDGFTLLKQIQQHLQWQHLPIVVVSAYAFDSDRQRALGLGARQYLVKPVNLNQLRQVVATYCCSSAESSECF